MLHQTQTSIFFSFGSFVFHCWRFDWYDRKQGGERWEMTCNKGLQSDLILQLMGRCLKPLGHWCVLCSLCSSMILHFWAWGKYQVQVKSRIRSQVRIELKVYCDVWSHQILDLTQFKVMFRQIFQHTVFTIWTFEIFYFEVHYFWVSWAVIHDHQNKKDLKCFTLSIKSIENMRFKFFIKLWRLFKDWIEVHYPSAIFGTTLVSV